MRRPQGYAVITDRDTGQKQECDTISCKHCGKIGFVKPRQDPASMGGWCGQCCGYICKQCTDEGSCKPLMKRIEEMEARGRFFRALEG